MVTNAPSVRTDDKGRFSVRRADGSGGTYDLTEGTYTAHGDGESGTERGLRSVTASDAVPTYCRVCHPDPASPWHARPAVDHLLDTIATRPGPPSLALVGGTACIFQTRQPFDGGPPREGGAGGDIDAEYIRRYAQHPVNAATTLHPSGALMYGHSVDVGAVHCYWHVHAHDVTYLNACASITCPIAKNVVDEYVKDNVGNGVALSLGSYDVGRNEIIRDLSVVIVPARGGCFGRVCEPTDRAACRQMLNRLGFTTSDPFVQSAQASVGGADAPRIAASRSASSDEQSRLLLTATARMLKSQTQILKLTKSHKDTILEKYINRGIDRYCQLTGDECRPKVLEAAMDLSALLKDDEGGGHGSQLKDLVRLGLKQLIETSSAQRGHHIPPPLYYNAAYQQPFGAPPPPPQQTYPSRSRNHRRQRRASPSRSRSPVERRAPRVRAREDFPEESARRQLFTELAEALSQKVAVVSPATVATVAPVPSIAHPAPTVDVANELSTIRDEYRKMHATLQSMVESLQPTAAVPVAQRPSAEVDARVSALPLLEAGLTIATASETEEGSKRPKVSDLFASMSTY